MIIGECHSKQKERRQNRLEWEGCFSCSRESKISDRADKRKTAVTGGNMSVGVWCIQARVRTWSFIVRFEALEDLEYKDDMTWPAC